MNIMKKNMILAVIIIGANIFAAPDKFTFSGECKLEGKSIGSFLLDVPNLSSKPMGPFSFPDDKNQYFAFASLVPRPGNQHEVSLGYRWMDGGIVLSRVSEAANAKPGDKLRFYERFKSADGKLTLLTCEGISAE